MVIVYLIAIVLLANNLLFATNFSKLAPDIGIVLIGLGLLYYLYRSRELSRLLNVFSLWMFQYLTLVLVQVAIASFQYGQSVFDGIIGARSQFYYLSFPLFVLTLNSAKNARTLMTALSVLGIIIVFLAFIHNLGIYNVFIGWGDEWKLQGERAGIIRFWFPGLDILIFTGIWQFLRYMNDERILSTSLGTFGAIFVGVLMRQSRARIIALVAVLGLMAYRRRKYGLIVFAGFLLLIAVLVPATGTNQNILIQAFETAYSDLSEGEGTWSAREKQIQIAKQVLRETFWFGSGAVALRGISDTTDWDEVNVKTIVYSADLGYWTWLKYYGFMGIVLLLLMVYGFIWYAFKRHRKSDWELLVELAVYHWLCVWVSLITLPYLTRPSGIIMICLSWALMVNGTISTEQGRSRRGEKKGAQPGE